MALGKHQGLDLRVAPHPLDGRHHRLPAQQARCPVRCRLHHVRALEYSFLARQIGRQRIELFGQLPDTFTRDTHFMADDPGDQRLALGKAL